MIYGCINYNIFAIAMADDVAISNLFLFKFLQNACFLFLNKTNKRKTNKHILAHITHRQMHLFVQYWRILDFYTKIWNVIPYTWWDKIFNLTLKFELDLTIFVQILKVSPQFQHNTVHIVTALIILFIVWVMIMVYVFSFSMCAPVMVELEGETDPLQIAMKELK